MTPKMNRRDFLKASTMFAAAAAIPTNVVRAAEYFGIDVKPTSAFPNEVDVDGYKARVFPALDPHPNGLDSDDKNVVQIKGINNLCSTYVWGKDGVGDKLHSRINVNGEFAPCVFEVYSDPATGETLIQFAQTAYDDLNADIPTYIHAPDTQERVNKEVRAARAAAAFIAANPRTGVMGHLAYSQSVSPDVKGYDDQRPAILMEGLMAEGRQTYSITKGLVDRAASLEEHDDLPWKYVTEMYLRTRFDIPRSTDGLVLDLRVDAGTGQIDLKNYMEQVLEAFAVKAPNVVLQDDALKAIINTCAFMTRTDVAVLEQKGPRARLPDTTREKQMLDTILGHYLGGRRVSMRPALHQNNSITLMPS